MALHHSPRQPSHLAQQGSVPSGETETSRPNRLLLTGDALVGSNVVSRVGEDYGKIESVVFDVETGQLAYVVLSYGGFAGMGLRFYAIPWQALRVDWDRQAVVLDIDKEHLRAAPGFQQGHWPAMEDAQWAEDVHRHFGVRPYWERPSA